MKDDSTDHRDAPRLSGASRRTALGAMMLPLAGLLPSAVVAQEKVEPDRRRRFVLVHGAYSGGWIWKMVTQQLRARGHEVWTPTLSGLGERSHLARFDIDLTTHIRDVVNCIHWEGLDGAGITLAGHSYAGTVISGVAEELPEGTADSFVVIDGALPLDGQSHFSYFGRDTEGLPQVMPLGDGVGDDYPEPIRSWIKERMMPHPTGSFIEPLQLSGARERIRAKTFIKATGPGTVSFPHRTVERIREDPSWRYEELACGHNTPVEMPLETAAALERAAWA